uniref:Uncharacterized protein n=1 Tax=Anguilla anguilla TaxID=7936 RepID=A0A0E9TA56_ANGAN
MTLIRKVNYVFIYCYNYTVKVGLFKCV